MKLTKRDFNLLTALRKNSRLTLTQMSKETKIPISTLYDRLKMQTGKTITKHTSILDFTKLGYATRMIVYLQVDALKRKELERCLQVHENINNVYEVVQDFDYGIEGIFKNIQEATAFIRQLQERFPSIKYQSHFINRDIVREKFLPQAS